MSGLIVFAVFLAFCRLLDKVESVIQMKYQVELNKAQLGAQKADSPVEEEKEERHIGFINYGDHLLEVEDED